MKSVNKELFILGLLICFISIAQAQITEIPFKPMSKEFKTQIKWDNDKLFVTYPTGIFYRDYSTGDVPEDWGQRKEHQWEMYGFAGHEINDFVINGDKILGTTSNPGPDGHLLIRSNDGGKTFEEFTPEGLNFIYAEGGYNKKSRFLIQNPNDKDELLWYCSSLYKSTDFGQTWEMLEVGGDTRSLKYHPIDSNIIIFGWNSYLQYMPNGTFYKSIDGGKNWEPINYAESEFGSANTIAYHPTNENLIILGSYPIIKSEDKGQTWETIVGYYEEPKIICDSFEFDVRGSNRLYGICQKWDSDIHLTPKLICYSDDFGATWNELCEISLGEDDYLVDFVQHGDIIFTISNGYKVHQIDLELLETAVEKIASDNSNISIKIEGNNLKINSQEAISSIEIYNISGVKLLSMDYNETAIDISELSKGTYVVRLHTTTDNAISIKFNK